MRKISTYFFILHLFLYPLTIFAQSNAPAVNLFREEQRRFSRILKMTSIDSAIINPLARFFDSEVNAVNNMVIADAGLPNSDKEKAIRSLAFFSRELGNSIESKRIDIYDIPSALKSYRSTLAALLYHRPLAPVLKSMGPQFSQLLATAFTQYKEYAVLDDVAAYKRIASSPEFILQFLEKKPGFRFADSLLLDAAAYDPLRVVFYLNNGGAVQDKIRSTNNIYLKQIVTLSQHKNASELLPFVMQIAEGRITQEEVLEKRKNIVQYYQLLINTLQEVKDSKDSSCIFIKPLRSAIKQKSLDFFVNGINDLHSASDAVRFASVKGLRPEDIYYIITSCGQDLYTSSYLGLYKRLMENFKGQTAHSLFDSVNNDNFKVFIRLAANYNVLADFLQNMPEQERKQLLKDFIAGIEGDSDTGLESAMDIADCFTAVNASPEISGLIESELQANLSRCKSNQNYLGVRLYSILFKVFSLVKQDGDLDKLWGTLGNYDVLKANSLENKNDEIVQVVLFYGDEDGVASFSSFLKSYTDSKRWEISRNKNFVSIRSLSGQPMLIYANLPLESKDELDIKAQDSLFAYLAQQSLEPTVLVHRGHSYHLDKTLKRLTPSVKLAILGSCGGYNKAISIASINPDVQVIGSKKTGAKSINDPILYEINDALGKGDVSWPEIWSKLTTRFSKDEGNLTLFNEYIPPNKNVSLFVLKLFIYNNKFV